MMVEKRLHVLVGDANGVDKAVQSYLQDKRYELVEVFCAGSDCRNNVGGWPTRAVAVNSKKRDFDFYATKDRLMAYEASLGFMIWDGSSVGTLLNVLRLIWRQKKVVVYNVPTKAFSELSNETDWESFLLQCPPDLRQRLEHKTIDERFSDAPSLQMKLI
jgi:hypothetical protein